MIKFWLSIDEDEQRARIENRKASPLTYWKFSANDENALSYYDQMTLLKERVIEVRLERDRLQRQAKGHSFPFGNLKLQT